MNISRKERIITETIFTDEDFSCNYYELLNLLEEFDGTAYGGHMIVINDSNIEKYLIDKKAIYKTVRGSCYENKKVLEELLEQIYKLDKK